MPDRIVRANILTSDSVNCLSWAAEVFYRRLMSVADDYGRYDGRAPVLRAALYPLKIDRVSDADIGKWKLEAAEAGLVSIYFADNREYLEIAKFDQRINGKPKWPAPVDSINPPGLPGKAGNSPLTRARSSPSPNTSLTQGIEVKEKGGHPVSESPPDTDAVLDYAKNGPTPTRTDIAMAWMDARARDGWKTKRDGHTYEISDWRADLRSFARAYVENESRRKHHETTGTHRAGSSGSLNLKGRYASKPVAAGG